jgi:hypothetical protein
MSRLEGGEERKTDSPGAHAPGEQLTLFSGAIANIKAPAQSTTPTQASPARPSPSPEKKAKLNRAVDRIREKFGEKGIRPAALLDDE